VLLHIRERDLPECPLVLGGEIAHEALSPIGDIGDHVHHRGLRPLLLRSGYLFEDLGRRLAGRFAVGGEENHVRDQSERLFQPEVGARAMVELPFILFCIGILLFSGSLYALAFFNVRNLGYITPFGGLSLLAGWLVLAIRPSQS